MDNKFKLKFIINKHINLNLQEQLKKNIINGILLMNKIFLPLKTFS